MSCKVPQLEKELLSVTAAAIQLHGGEELDILDIRSTTEPVRCPNPNPDGCVEYS